MLILILQMIAYLSIFMFLTASPEQGYQIILGMQALTGTIFLFMIIMGIFFLYPIHLLIKIDRKINERKNLKIIAETKKNHLNDKLKK